MVLSTRPDRVISDGDVKGNKKKVKKKDDDVKGTCRRDSRKLFS